MVDRQREFIENSKPFDDSKHLQNPNADGGKKNY